MFNKLMVSFTLIFSVSVFAQTTKKLETLGAAETYEKFFDWDWPFGTQDDSEPISITEEMKDRIIIAGDSWAVFPCGFKSMEKVLASAHADLRNDKRCNTTSKIGMDARDWLGSSEDKNLTKILETDSRIKYIYLSLGGNDLMAEWNIEMTTDQEQALLKKVFETLQKITDKYVTINPNIKIILSGYDYPNFQENHKIPLYRKIYNNMGKPSVLRINTALAGFSQYMVQIVDYKNRFYVHHLGLAHYYDGTGPTVLGLPTTKSPAEISPFNQPELIGGDLYSKTREESLMVWLKVFHDAFHLNEQNYFNVIQHTYDNVLIHILP